MKASDLLQEFRSALHDSMGLMEREVCMGRDVLKGVGLMRVTGGVAGPHGAAGAPFA
jgi:hypothetical protein